MHRIIENGLEEYFEGRPSREFDVHLAQCEACRADVSAFQEVSGMLTGFRTGAPPEPSLGFSARVLRSVQEDRKRNFWQVVSLDPGFTRKLALASLLGLAVLGGYLVTDPNDATIQTTHTPEAVMASHDVTSPDIRQHQNGMLMTLATYHQ